MLATVLRPSCYQLSVRDLRLTSEALQGCSPFHPLARKLLKGFGQNNKDDSDQGCMRCSPLIVRMALLSIAQSSTFLMHPITPASSESLRVHQLCSILS